MSVIDHALASDRYPIPEQFMLTNKEATARWLADTCEISIAQGRRWVDRGMNWEEAERFAVRQGVIPDALWPDWDVPVARQVMPHNVASCWHCNTSITLGRMRSVSRAEQVREFVCRNGHVGELVMIIRMIDDDS